MKIRWNTKINAPYLGEIVAKGGRTLLIQTDWDYPGVASCFGWSTLMVQRCLQCGQIADVMPDGHAYHCDTWAPECDHDHTDGTVDCPDCGVTSGDFIAAACAWLGEHDGAKADDPGYFDERGDSMPWH